MAFFRKKKDENKESFDFIKTAEYFNSHRKPKKINFLFCPDWMEPEYDDAGNYAEDPDPLFVLCDPFVQRRFYSHGQPAIGALVQANVALFKKGKDDHPANFLYSTDPYYIEHKEELLGLANAIFATKGEQGYFPSIQKIADLLAAETDREFAIKMPRDVTEGRNVYLTTVLVARHHLEKERITEEIMPMIVLEGEEPDAMIMPYWYWQK